MKTLIYLIVLCTIFNANQSQPTDNNVNITDTPKKDLNEVTKRSSDRPPELSNKKSGIKPEKADVTTERLTDETKQHKEPGPSKSVRKRDLSSEENSEEYEALKPTEIDRKMNNSTEMPSPKVSMSSPTNTTFTPLCLPLVNESNSDRNSIYLPTYAMGIIMFAMALMFFIIMALLLILYKIKQDKRRRDSMNVSIEPKNENTQKNYKYSRHLSDEGSNVSTLLKDKTKDSKLVLTRSDSKALFINNLDAIDLNKEKSPNNDFKTSRINIPESNPSTPQVRPPTLTRILKQPSINHVPITREQMSELCEGVLSKKKRSNETTSLSDIEKLLNESKKEEKHNIDMEKCLSTPELDIDMYDVLPTPSPRKFIENPDGIKNDEFDDELYESPPTNHIKKNNDLLKKHENEESNDEVYDNPVPHKHDNEVFDDGIYDNPPPNNNRKRNVVVSTDEDYVMPLTNDIGLYCNAKDFVDNKICTN